MRGLAGRAEGRRDDRLGAPGAAGQLRARAHRVPAGRASCAATDGALAAYPMGKGSGSVTTFSRADGFVRIPRNVEIVEAGEEVAVTLVGRELALADLVVDRQPLRRPRRHRQRPLRRGLDGEGAGRGEPAGLDAAARGECDVAPIHLLDPATGRYNAPFLGPGLRLLEGYRRMQGVVTRPTKAARPPSCSPTRRSGW